MSSASSEPLCPSRPRPAGGPGFHPARAEVNSARGKVLPPAKRLHGAGAAPSAMGKPAATTAATCRRPRPSRCAPAGPGRPGARISSRAGGSEFRPHGQRFCLRQKRLATAPGGAAPICDRGKPAGPYDKASNFKFSRDPSSEPAGLALNSREELLTVSFLFYSHYPPVGYPPQSGPS